MNIRIRSRAAVPPDPRWIRAPSVLFRFPKALAAVAGGGVVIGLVAGASSLFLSASANAAFSEQARTTPAFVAGANLRVRDSQAGPSARERTAERRAAADGVLGRLPHLDEPIETFFGSVVQLDVGQTQAVRGRVLFRTGAYSRLTILEEDPSVTGVLIQLGTWRSLDEPELGDEIDLSVGGRIATTRLRGVYSPILHDGPITYWHVMGEHIYPDTGWIPPPFLIAKEEEFFRLGTELKTRDDMIWNYPLARSDLPMQEADALANGIKRISDAIHRDLTLPGPRRQRLLEAFEDGHADAALPALVDAAHETRAALEGPVQALTIAGAAVALLVMFAAGMYVVLARRTETVMLAARGMSPVAVGLRSTLESALPATAGAIAGWLAAWALVSRFGPTDVIAGADLTRSVVFAGALLVAGLSVGAFGAAVSSRALGEAGYRTMGLYARVPWELLPIAGAGVLYATVLRRETVLVGIDDARIDPVVLLFPVLFLGGIAALLARVLRALLHRLRNVGRVPSAAAYLAGRRIATSGGLVFALITVTATAIGVFAYSMAVAGTVETSAQAKARVFVGSDLSRTLFEFSHVPELQLDATRISRLERLRLTDGTNVDVLGIDPHTFGRAAFWDDRFADEPLGALLSRLENGGPGMPVIVVDHGDIDADTDLDLSPDVDLRSVGNAPFFPGMTGARPLLVTTTDRLHQELTRGGTTANTPTYELWVKGDPERTRAVLNAAGIAPLFEIDVNDVLDTPLLDAVTWTFDLLRMLGIFSALLASMSLLLYLQARERRNLVASALGRRMGITGRDEAVALLLELAILLTFSVVAGAGLGAATLRLIYARFDVLPDIPPTPLLNAPWLEIAAICVLACAAALGGVFLVRMAARRASIGELLRVGA